MTNDRNRICPVEGAGALDSKVRLWFQNPEKILRPYVKTGMTVLDVGCGPGFFSLPLALLVGENGRVISADLQVGMLQRLKEKIEGTELDRRIVPVQCGRDSLNVSTTVDFALAFYMVHEVPDKARFFQQMRSIVRDGGQVLFVEPKLFHVSRTDFNSSLALARTAGFGIAGGPRLPFSWSAVLN